MTLLLTNKAYMVIFVQLSCYSTAVYIEMYLHTDCCKALSFPFHTHILIPTLFNTLRICSSGCNLPVQKLLIFKRFVIRPAEGQLADFCVAR